MNLLTCFAATGFSNCLTGGPIAFSTWPIIQGVVMTLFLLVALLLLMVILIQEGKGGGIAGAFGGSVGETFGVKAGTINRFTAVLASIFVGLALIHASIESHISQPLFKAPPPVEVAPPAEPGFGTGMAAPAAPAPVPTPTPADPGMDGPAMDGAAMDVIVPPAPMDDAMGVTPPAPAPTPTPPPAVPETPAPAMTETPAPAMTETPPVPAPTPVPVPNPGPTDAPVPPK